MNKQTTVFIIIIIATLTTSAIIVNHNLPNNEDPDENHSDNTSPNPQPKEVTVDIKVQPWYGTIDLAYGYGKYGIEVESPKPDQLSITTENVTLKINVMSKGWVIQYAYFFSDLVEDKVHIPINFSNSNWITDLRKTFTLNFSNVPDGSHTVDFFVVLHDGTTGIAKINFTVNT